MTVDMNQTPHTPQQLVEELFRESATSSSPALTLVVGSSGSGRSQATPFVSEDGVVVNAADLAESTTADPREAAESAAQLLQLALMHARQHRHSIVVEGRFRSAQLLSAIARLFADDDFTVRVVAVAHRDTESRMSTSSRRFDALRQGQRVEALGDADASTAELLASAAESASVDRITIFDREGTVAADVRAEASDLAQAPSAFEAATREKLGTLRSTLWLSELRHMTRFVSQQRSVPRWAIDELIELHELALAEIVPELPIAADSETRVVQEERLTASLTALRNFVRPEVQGPDAAPVIMAPTPGLGLSR